MTHEDFDDCKERIMYAMDDLQEKHDKHQAQIGDFIKSIIANWKYLQPITDELKLRRELDILRSQLP